MESSSAVDDQENSDKKDLDQQDLELLETLAATTGQELPESSGRKKSNHEEEEEVPDVSDDGRRINVAFPNARRTLMKEALANRNVPYGQCFEHFYREALNEKNPGRFQKLAGEPLGKIFERSRNTDSDELQLSLERETGELISKLYYLAAKKWEENPNVYLRVLDDFNKGKICDRAHALFSRTQEFFVQSFGDDRKERGESVELIDQIVKRTGEHTREQFSRVLSGVNVEKTAVYLWELWNSEDTRRFEKLEEILALYTDHQVRELRIEFNSIPARILADEIHEILSSVDASEELDDSIVAGEELCYLLRGRTQQEIELIEYHYNEKYHFTREELPLREELEELLTPEQMEDVESCLVGFSAVERANEIARLLCASEEEEWPFDYELLPPVYSGAHPIREEYQKILPKRRIYRKEDRQTWERELLAQKAISHSLRGLSYEQFLLVNEELLDTHNLELDYELYPQVRLFDARGLLSRVKDLLSHARSLSSVFSALDGFNPDEMRSLKEAWAIAEGTEFDQVVEGIVEFLFGKRVPDVVQSALSRRLSGVSRLPLEKDLLEFVDAPFLGQPFCAPRGEKEQVYCRDVLLQLAKLLQGESQEGKQKDREVLSLLSELPYETRTQLEWVFHSKTGQTLRASLQTALSSEAALEADLLLSGFNARACMKQMNRELDSFVLMRDRDYPCIAFVNEFCRLENGKDFLQAVLEHDFAEEKGIASRDYGLILAHTPGAAVLREALFSGSAFESQVDDLLSALTGLGFEHILAFERAYDKNFGSLRRDLKEALGEERIEARRFACAGLMLEGLPMELVDMLETMVEAGKVKEIQDILLHHRFDIATLEECYNVVHSDAPLRRSIDSCKASRGEINKTILYLDCFYPDEVALELAQIFDQSEDLENRVMTVLADPFEEGVENTRLPKDLTWISEMYLQVRKHYRLQRGSSLLEDAAQAGFSRDSIDQLTSRLYGREIVEFAMEIRENRNSGESFGKMLAEKSKGKILRFLNGVVEFYDIQSHLLGERTLQEELSAADLSANLADEIRKSFQKLVII